MANVAFARRLLGTVQYCTSRTLGEKPHPAVRLTRANCDKVDPEQPHPGRYSVDSVLRPDPNRAGGWEGLTDRPQCPHHCRASRAPAVILRARESVALLNGRSCVRQRARPAHFFLSSGLGIAARMAEQTASYSIETKEQSTERVTTFTFVDVTADEMEIVLAELRRIFGRMRRSVVVKLTAPDRGLAA